MYNRRYIYLLIFSIMIAIGTIDELKAQSPSHQVIASAGGYQSSAIGSISFTIGETNIQTLTSANNILTQGFQQPFLIIGTNFRLKLFIEGYYIGSGLMQPVLYNTGLSISDTDCDSIIIELHDQFSYSTIYTNTVVLKTNGLATVHYPASVIGSSYYIVVRSRNSIETWSKMPVTFSDPIIYFDFSAP